MFKSIINLAEKRKKTLIFICLCVTSLKLCLNVFHWLNSEKKKAEKKRILKVLELNVFD